MRFRCGCMISQANKSTTSPTTCSSPPELYISSHSISQRLLDAILIYAVQSRVPGARLIIIGTHADQLESTESAENLCESVITSLKDRQKRLQTLLNEKYDKALETSITLETSLKEKTREVLAVMRDKGYEYRLSDEKDPNSDENGDDEIRDKVVADIEKELEESSMGTLEATVRVLVADMKAERTEQAILTSEVSKLAQVRDMIQPDKVIAVSSLDMYGMDAAREAVEKAVEDKAVFPSLGEQIPLSYFQVLDFNASPYSLRVDRSSRQLRDCDGCTG